MKAWASAKSIRNTIADVPTRYLELFAANLPAHVRKFGDGATGAVVYDTAMLLSCIRRGVRFSVPDCPEGYGPHAPETAAKGAV